MASGSPSIDCWMPESANGAEPGRLLELGLERGDGEALAAGAGAEARPGIRPGRDGAEAGAGAAE